MMAVLVAMFDRSMAQLTAVRNVAAGLANCVAAAGFAIFGPVVWTAALPLAAGFLAGGWLGPGLVRRLPDRALRIAIGVSGVLVAIKFGVDTYSPPP